MAWLELFQTNVKLQSALPNELGYLNGKTGLGSDRHPHLNAVQTHGQLTKSRLAEIVNLSPTPGLARLKRLKADGFIKGFHANIALNRIVDFTQVMVTVSAYGEQ